MSAHPRNRGERIALRSRDARRRDQAAARKAAARLVSWQASPPSRGAIGTGLVLLLLLAALALYASVPENHPHGVCYPAWLAECVARTREAGSQREPHPAPGLGVPA